MTKRKNTKKNTGLSRADSKYIGETEKNLRQAFVRAEKTEAIHFFDESGVLFGERTEPFLRSKRKQRP